MFATKTNMRKVISRYNKRSAAPEILAYSPWTGQACSAYPGDYFHLADDEPLVDSRGKPMILVRRVPAHFDPID